MLERAPRDAPDEDAYRAHFLRTDTIPAVTLTSLVVVGSVIILLKNDRLLFAPGPELYRLIAVRMAEIALCLGAIAVFVRSKSPRQHDRAIFVVLATMVLANFYIVSTRPPEYLGHGSVSALAITLFYFAMPGPLVARTAAALALSVSTFVFTLRATMPVLGFNAMLVTHVMTHAIGIPMAVRIEGLRRRRFSAEMKEKRALAELAQKALDLEIAKERAEALTRVKSDFLATMSHEFRTPMNAVIGLSELLGESPLAPDQRDLVRTIQDSAGALLVLLNDILDLAKIDAGRMEIERAPFDIRALAEGSLAVVRHGASVKGLAVEFSIDEGVTRGALGDATRLRQALVNLLSNAVKFTEKGKVALRISSRRLAGEEHELCFRVEDSGVGISPETLKRLFAPFEQGDASATRRHSGTGLGLSITKRIIELMGGAVRVESIVGRGSTFELTLPLREADPPSALQRASVGRIAEELPLRILVVEDNAVNQRVALATLRRLGYRADVVENGKDALSAMERGVYDVVFMDLRMPEMDGIETTRRAFAALPEGRRPRVVAMTASAFEEDRAACLDVGMADFLSKPIGLRDLRDALLRAEKKPRASAPAGAALLREPLDKLRELGTLGEPGFFEDLCRQFLIDTEARLDRMEEKLAAGDRAGVELEAHSLKASSASMGASGLAGLCAALEAAARGEALPGAEEIGLLRREFGEVAIALQREMGRGA